MPKLALKLLPILKSQATIILLVSLIVLTINILVIGKIRPFNSDDLYWQQVVKTWFPFNGETLFLATKDTFIEIVPLFWILENIFEPSRKLLLFETLVLTLSTFIIFYYSSLYFLKKLRLKISYTSLLPFLWLASFGYPLVQNYLNTNWRTFEVGVAFATYVFAAAICFGDFKPLSSIRTKILSILAVIYIGIVAFSDPYYVYFALGPIALMISVLYLLKKIKRREAYLILGGIVLSVIVAQITTYLLKWAGVIVVTATPSIFVNFDNILTNIVASLHGMLIIFNADFFGRPVAKISTMIAMVNAAILGVIIYKTWIIIRNLNMTKIHRISTPKFWFAFFALVNVVTFSVYTISTLVTVDNYRFFIILVYSSVTLLACILASSKNNVFRRLVALLLIIAAIGNTTYTSFGNDILRQPSVATNVSNSFNYRLIDVIQSEGLTKGYANYWHGNVNTYFSNGKTVFLPVVCFDNTTKPFKWLIDGSLYEREASRSFYFHDPDATQPPMCGPKELFTQFGKPAKTITIANKSIYIYDYDIGTKLVEDWQP